MITDPGLRAAVQKLIDVLRSSGMVAAGSPADQTLRALQDEVSDG